MLLRKVIHIKKIAFQESTSDVTASRLTRPKAKPKPLVLPDSFRHGHPPVSSPLSSSPCSSLSPSTLNSPAPSSSPSVSCHNHASLNKPPQSPSLQTPFFGNFPTPSFSNLPSPSLFPNYSSPFIPLATPLSHPHSHALNTQLHFWSSLSPLAVASPRPVSTKSSTSGADSGGDGGPPSSAPLLSAFPNSSALPSLSPSHFTFPVPAFPFTPLSFSNPLRSPLFTPAPHLGLSGHRKEREKDKPKDEADDSVQRSEERCHVKREKLLEEEKEQEQDKEKRERTVSAPKVTPVSTSSDS